MNDHPIDPQRSVVVLTQDLFFGMRIRNALKQLGYITILKETEAAFEEGLASPGCVLGFVDFNDHVDWQAISSSLGTGDGPAVVAFGSHTDTDGFRQAREAGVTRVISNGAFSQQLPELIERYAAQD